MRVKVTAHYFLSSPQSVMAMVALNITKPSSTSLPRRSAISSEVLQSLQHVHSLLHLTKDHMATIQPRAGHSGDEELRSVGIRSAVGHGQETRAVVLQVEVLISELLSVDGLTSHTVAHGEISSLPHHLHPQTGPTWHMN